MLNIFKHITSVEVRKDLSEKIVTFKLEPQSCPAVTSWWVLPFSGFDMFSRQTVLEDLEKKETPAVKKWAESIQKFGPQYQNFIQVTILEISKINCGLLEICKIQ